MIQKVHIKDLVSFQNVSLDFEDSLVVITGPSGAGKSILMGAILGCFGYNQPSYATICELSLNVPSSLKSNLYEFDEDIILKSIKKDKLRFSLNDQLISKKGLEEIFGEYILYLSVRDKSKISSKNLLDILDGYIIAKDVSYRTLLQNYREKFTRYANLQNTLEATEQKERNANELLEFARFEVEKIESINPKIGEDEELLRIKSRLSRIDKIKESLASLEKIFELESQAYELHRLLDKDIAYLSDAFTQLRLNIEDAASLQEELAELDIEVVLDRLEKLSSLKNRYGSIEEALEYLRQKKEEIESFVSIQNNKEQLNKEVNLLKEELLNQAQKISLVRQNEAEQLTEILNDYLEKLKLHDASFMFENTSLKESGADILSLSLGSSQIETLSGGEFNRLKIALLASSSTIKDEKRVLILDEIDANVSGDESIAIAQMLKHLSKSYQIFAISHQPHLSSRADQHILVTKEGQVSIAKPLNGDERVSEIARIIDGKEPTSEALKFAKKILG
ncbi:MAG: DNA recombination protein RecN [Campylobacterales bacterium]|nr:DNA recombination protein RecN [Campylobacterales bacterium]